MVVASQCGCVVNINKIINIFIIRVFEVDLREQTQAQFFYLFFSFLFLIHKLIGIYYVSYYNENISKISNNFHKSMCPRQITL